MGVTTPLCLLGCHYLSGLLVSLIVIEELRCTSQGCLSQSSVCLASPHSLIDLCHMTPCYKDMFLLLVPPLSVYTLSRNSKHIVEAPVPCLDSHCIYLYLTPADWYPCYKRDRPQGEPATPEDSAQRQGGWKCLSWVLPAVYE